MLDKDLMQTYLVTTDSPKCEVYVGDCTVILPHLPAEDRFDLIFADPSFNNGTDYDSWNDLLDLTEYKAFTQAWLSACYDRLTERGSLWVNVPDEIVSYIDQYATGFLHLERVNWVISHHRFGQWNNGAFIRSKCHLLYYVKDRKKSIWHPERVLVPSDRARKYKDKRTLTSKTPGQRVPLDVWEFPRVQGNNKERRPLHKNQLPEKLLERILLACTEEDSLVLDPYLGSGTSCVVARALGLQSIGIEISERYAKSAFERLQKGAVRVCPANPTT